MAFEAVACIAVSDASLSPILLSFYIFESVLLYPLYTLHALIDFEGFGVIYCEIGVSYVINCIQSLAEPVACRPVAVQPGPWPSSPP